MGLCTSFGLACDADNLTEFDIVVPLDVQHHDNGNPMVYAGVRGEGYVFDVEAEKFRQLQESGLINIVDPRNLVGVFAEPYAAEVAVAGAEMIVSHYSLIPGNIDIPFSPETPEQATQDMLPEIENALRVIAQEMETAIDRPRGDRHADPERQAAFEAAVAEITEVSALADKVRSTANFPTYAADLVNKLRDSNDLSEEMKGAVLDNFESVPAGGTAPRLGN